MVDDGAELENLAARLGRTVREHRAERRASLGELARRSGLSKTILARIERGEGNPSVETLWRVARGLGVPLSALLGEADRPPPTRLVRAGSGDVLLAESGMAAWLVHAARSPQRAEVFELRFDRGVEQRGEPHLPGTEELVVCLAGTLLVGPLGEEEELRAGDALWFAADVEHRYVARRAARALDLILYVPGAERSR